jgi:hypothetical protein
MKDEKLNEPVQRENDPAGIHIKSAVRYVDGSDNQLAMVQVEFYVVPTSVAKSLAQHVMMAGRRHLIDVHVLEDVPYIDMHKKEKEG